MTDEQAFQHGLIFYRNVCEERHPIKFRQRTTRYVEPPQLDLFGMPVDLTSTRQNKRKGKADGKVFNIEEYQDRGMLRQWNDRAKQTISPTSA